MSNNSEIQCINGNLVFKSKTYSLSSEKVSNNFQKFRQSGSLCDVDLVSGDTVQKAHRVVLAAACVYFETMFNSGLEECDKKSVFLPSIPPNILPLVVEFIYTGQTVINSFTIQHLIDAADMLQLQELSAGCAEYLKTLLHPSNVLGVISFAEAHNCFEVAEEALSYAQKHWKTVIEGDEIVNVPPTLLIKLLSSDKLMIDDEIQILHPALSWLDHDPASRRQHCVEVLRQVRLRALKPHALESALMNVRDPFVAEIARVFKAVMESEVNTKPRQVAECYLYVVGGHQRHSPTVIEKFATGVKFDVHKKEWKEIAPMCVARSMLGVATLGALLYAVGGENNDKALASGEVYDPITDSWTPIASMQKPRQCFGLAAVNKKLYAFGGIGDALESSIEVYDPEIDEWSLVGEMPGPKSDMSVVTYGEAVYLVGGRTQAYEYTNDVLRYDPARAEWRRLKPLLLGRAAAASVANDAVLSQSLYIIGGQSTDVPPATDMVECYNLQTEESSFTCEMSEARLGCVVGSMGDTLMVAGGDSGAVMTATTTAGVEIYDPAQAQWCDGPALPQPRAYAGAAFI